MLLSPETGSKENAELRWRVSPETKAAAQFTARRGLQSSLAARGAARFVHEGDAIFKRIMIATDGSETSERAAMLGIEIARISGGQVTAIYVVDIHRLSHLPGYTTLPGLSKRLLELMQKEGKEATDQVREMADEAGVACEAMIAEGDPSTEILRRSKESDANLLILGTKGTSGLDRVLLGSVAEKVTRNSRIPVLLFPGKRN